MTRIKLGGFDEKKSKKMLDSIIDEIKKDPELIKQERESILIDIAPIHEKILSEEISNRDNLDREIDNIALGKRYMS